MSFVARLGYDVGEATINDETGGYYKGTLISQTAWTSGDTEYYEHTEVETVPTGKLYITLQDAPITAQSTAYLYKFWGYNGRCETKMFTQNGDTQDEFDRSYDGPSTKSVVCPATDRGREIKSGYRYSIQDPAKGFFFKSSLPIFLYEDEESILKYLQTGDITGAYNYQDLTGGLGANFRVYVNGDKKPSIKITWQPINDNIPKWVNIQVQGYQFLPYPTPEPIDFHINSIDFDSGNTILTWQSLEDNLGLQGLEYVHLILYVSGYDGTGSSIIYGGKVIGETDKSGNNKIITSENNNTTLEMFNGSSGDDDGYNDPNNTSDYNDSFNVHTGVNTLTTTYACDDQQIQQFGDYLWSADIFDNIKLINNSPIENVVSVKSMPIDISGTSANIKLGNIDTHVTATKIGKQGFKKLIGSLIVPRQWNNFLDMSPYTSITIYLPYIGFKTLDSSMFFNKKFGVKIEVYYIFDVITGSCEALIYSNNNVNQSMQPVASFTGNCGIDIPVTSSNRAQVETAIFSAGVGAITNAVSENVGGAVNSLLNMATTQFHTNTQGSPSPSCGAYMPNKVYIIVSRPRLNDVVKYGETYGFISHKTIKLSKLHGYTECINPKLSGIGGTDSEKMEILNLLTSGIYL